MININIKLGLFGDSDVGKSTIAHFLQTNRISQDKALTIGVDYMSKEYSVASDVNVKFQIWDTAGQERYNSIINKYYTVSIPVFIFDLSDKNTFEHIYEWYNQYMKNSRYKPIDIYLIGNKTDLKYNDDPEFTKEIKNFSIINNMKYFENSSIKDKKINEIFKTIANNVYTLYKTNKLLKFKNEISIESKNISTDYFQLEDNFKINTKTIKNENYKICCK